MSITFRKIIEKTEANIDLDATAIKSSPISIAKDHVFLSLKINRVHKRLLREYQGSKIRLLILLFI
jgi:hypothetical protein